MKGFRGYKGFGVNVGASPLLVINKQGDRIHNNYINTAFSWFDTLQNYLLLLLMRAEIKENNVILCDTNKRFTVNRVECCSYTTLI